MTATIQHAPSKALERYKPPVKSRAAYVAKQAASTATFHAARSPKHAGRMLLHSARGTVYTVPQVVRWVSSPNRREVVNKAKQGTSAKALESASNALIMSIVLRLALLVGPAAVGLTWLYQRMGTWAYVCFGGAILLITAVVGSRLSGTALVEKADPRRGDLTKERLNDAFQAVGLLKRPKADGDTYATELIIQQLPCQTFGPVPGVEAIVDLPPGSAKTAADVVANRGALAAELAVKAEQLVVEAGQEHEGQVLLWLASRDPFAGDPVLSGYPKEKRTNVWEGVRLGTDARGNPVELPLVWESWFIAGTPRRGKSSIGRLIASVGALDPYCDVAVIDAKGGKDWKPLEKLSGRFVLGSDPEPILETLADLVRLMNERYDIIQTLDDEQCPDGRITPELAETHDLRPVLVLFDELQEALAACDAKQRKIMEETISRLARKGPAAGIIGVVMSQRPDAKTIPAQFRGVVSTRVAVQCTDRQSSDLVLGEGSSARGLNASRLPFVDGEAARCIAVSGAFGSTVKTDWLPLAEFKALCERGYLLRSAANTLRSEEQKATNNLLDAAIACLEVQDNLTPTDLASAIAALTGDQYTAKELGEELARIGLSSKHNGKRREFRLRDARATFG